MADAAGTIAIGPAADVITAQQGQQELPLRLQLWQTSLGRQGLEVER